jgi:hypothetical protein
MAEDIKGEIIGKLLMPEATLESIGDAYGITRQRVKAIFEQCIGANYSFVKQAFVNEKFRCVICGDPINVHSLASKKRSALMFCSPDCEKIGKNYDLDEECTCQYPSCGIGFFANRNWKFTKKKDYCCTDHYFAHKKELNS